MGELADANGEVTRLTGELSTATGDVTRLMGELADANGEVTRLTGELADANIRIGELEARVAELEAGTAPDVLDPIKEAASDAHTAANDAYMAAGMAADAAETADDNRATVQTGEANSVYDATMARASADAAMQAAADALAASNAAQAAGNASDATAERVKAEAARDAAMTAQTEAEGHRDNAVMDSMAELKIDGTMKSVGDTTIDATAGASSIIIDGQATVTGLLESMNPEQTVAAVAGVDFVANTDPAADVAYVQAVAERTFDIGKVVDSADDTARLMLVTQYAGSKAVKVFAYAEADPDVNSTADGRTGTVMGKITLDDGDAETTDTNNTSLRSVGTFYHAGEATDTAGLSSALVVGDEAESMTVYSYVDDQDNTDPTDDVTVYLVMDSQRTAGGTTTYVYRSVDIMAAASDATTDGTAEGVQITANIPEATDYDHIHFGVWAGLKAAAKNGDQDIADLGIGFVQSIGDGMTGADMPNNGSGTYTGNWVAAIQAADVDGNGAITLTSGAASLMADFGDGEITATLTGLATLEGDISGSEFSGTKATVADDNTSNLTASSDDVAFSGSFMGGFYGSKAAEAGGVFDFASEDNEAGAFRGAFGADRK